MHCSIPWDQENVITYYFFLYIGCETVNSPLTSIRSYNVDSTATRADALIFGPLWTSLDKSPMSMLEVKETLSKVKLKLIQTLPNQIWAIICVGFYLEPYIPCYNIVCVKWKYIQSDTPPSSYFCEQTGLWSVSAKWRQEVESLDSEHIERYVLLFDGRQQFALKDEWISCISFPWNTLNYASNCAHIFYFGFYLSASICFM